MGRRTSPGRSLPGNAFGGVLRATQRQARAATRRAPRDNGEAAATAAATPVAPVAGTATTGADGVAHFVFPYSLDAAPVIAAVAVSHGPATVTVARVTCTATALHVWNADGSPAAAGTDVHVAVFPAS